jgi:hypothetical protein
MAMWAEAMLAIIMGMKKGLMRFGPLSRKTLLWASQVSIPPMPVPTRVPTRSGSRALGSSPESLRASSAAIRAYWTKRSRRRSSFLSR